MMQPELKQKWLAALRSGEYKQAKGRLKDDKGFCCLGVLCDIQGLLRSEETFYDEKINNYEFTIKDELGLDYTLRNHTFPPNEWLEMIGLDSEFAHELADKNDGLGIRRLTFKQIANLIEKKA